MIYTIQSNIPRCPKCAALMDFRVQEQKPYYICFDCGSIYQALNKGHTDNEILISDYEVTQDE